MGGVREYLKIGEARARFKELYDSAGRHVPTVMQRDADTPVVTVRRDDFLKALRALCPIEPQVSFSGTGVSMWIEGVPVSAQGEDLSAAESALLESLRAYADTWVDDLSRYPNHEEQWGLVNLVLLSADDELGRHLFGQD